MPTQNVELLPLFSAVTKALRQNKEAINEQDSYNHDHGTNMVKTFSTVTKVLKENQGLNPSDALAQAAHVLQTKTNSGSSQLYAQGLQQAANQVQGKNINPQVAMQLLQTILGGGQTGTAASAGSSLGNSLLGGAGGNDLGSMLSSLLGGSQTQAANTTSAGGGDLIGSLLGGLSGNQGQQTGGLQDGLDLGDVITAGMAFMQSKQSGASNINSLVAAFSAASGMGSSAHRQQSTQVVANSFLSALNKFMK